MNSNGITCVGNTGLAFSACSTVALLVYPGPASTCAVSSSGLQTLASIQASYPMVASRNPGALTERFLRLTCSDANGNKLGASLAPLGLPSPTLVAANVTSTFYGPMASDGVLVVSASTNSPGSFSLGLSVGVYSVAGASSAFSVSLSSSASSLTVSAGDADYSATVASGPGVSAALVAGTASVITLTATDSYGNAAKFTGSELSGAYSSLFRLNMTLYSGTTAGFDSLTLSSATPIVSSSTSSISITTQYITPQYSSSTNAYTYRHACAPAPPAPPTLPRVLSGFLTRPPRPPAASRRSSLATW